MKVLAMSRDIWVPRVYRFRNYLGQGLRELDLLA